MKFKTPDELEEMSRDKLLTYIDKMHLSTDRAQRELADSVRDELDIKFSYDALRKKYNVVLAEISQMLVETYGVDRMTASQVVREIDQHAAQEAATYPRGGCSG